MFSIDQDVNIIPLANLLHVSPHFEKGVKEGKLFSIRTSILQNIIGNLHLQGK